MHWQKRHVESHFFADPKPIPRSPSSSLWSRQRPRPRARPADLHRADQLAVLAASEAARRAIDRGWLWLHESGTYVKLTQASGDLFARARGIRPREALLAFTVSLCLDFWPALRQLERSLRRLPAPSASGRTRLAGHRMRTSSDQHSRPSRFHIPEAERFSGDR
jgi:hypothetical protein